MNRNHWLLVTALLCVVLYVFWILWPHVRFPKVINTAELSEAEVAEIVEQLEAKNAFPGRMEPRTILQDFINPWTRPNYAVEIKTRGGMRSLLWLTPYLDYPETPRLNFMAIHHENGDWIVSPGPRPTK